MARCSVTGCLSEATQAINLTVGCDYPPFWESYGMTLDFCRLHGDFMRYRRGLLLATA